MYFFIAFIQKFLKTSPASGGLRPGTPTRRPLTSLLPCPKNPPDPRSVSTYAVSPARWYLSQLSSLSKSFTSYGKQEYSKDLQKFLQKFLQN